MLLGRIPQGKLVPGEWQNKVGLQKTPMDTKDWCTRINLEPGVRRRGPGGQAFSHEVQLDSAQIGDNGPFCNGPYTHRKSLRGLVQCVQSNVDWLEVKGRGLGGLVVEVGYWERKC